MPSKTNTEQRKNTVLALVAAEKTQTEIAKELGVTRQRVQQIEKQLGIARGRKKHKKFYTLTCQYCGKKFKSLKPTQKYMNRECFRLARINKLSEEEKRVREERRKKKNREKANHYYHNVFKKRNDWQDIVRQRNQKNYATQCPH